MRIHSREYLEELSLDRKVMLQKWIINDLWKWLLHSVGSCTSQNFAFRDRRRRRIYQWSKISNICEWLYSYKSNFITYFTIINSKWTYGPHILIYIQQDATLHSLFYLETGLRVSSGTTTHYQERKQLYLQHLVFVTPLVLPAAIAAGSTNGVTNTRCCRYSCLRSW